MPRLRSFPGPAWGSCVPAPAAAGTCPTSAGHAGHPGTPGPRCAPQPARRLCRPRQACLRPGYPRPVKRHNQCRRVVHEVEQVIKPAARIGRHPSAPLQCERASSRPANRASHPRRRARSAGVIWPRCTSPVTVSTSQHPPDPRTAEPGWPYPRRSQPADLLRQSLNLTSSPTLTSRTPAPDRGLVVRWVDRHSTMRIPKS